MEAIDKKRIEEEIEKGNSRAKHRKPKKLDFVFITPNNGEYIEILAQVDYIKNLGHDIKVFHGTLEDMGDQVTEFDFYMTAGNSYGHLTGGYDGALAERFHGLQQSLISYLTINNYGELNVGDCFPAPFSSTDTADENEKIKTLLYTPTMRVPRRLPKGTDVPYLASTAALQRVVYANGNKVLAVLMGTGTGGIPPRVAIAQFCIALYNYTHGSNIKNLFRDGQKTNDAIKRTWEDGLWQLRLEEE